MVSSNAGDRRKSGELEQKVDLLHQSSTQYHSDENSSRAIPDNVTKSERTKNVRRQFRHQVSAAQSQGI